MGKERGEVNGIVDLLLSEWKLDIPGKLQRCMRKVLGELSCEAQLRLKSEPRLQVAVKKDAPLSIWAYFPVHRARLIVSGQKPEARVLLLISRSMVESQTMKLTCDQLRDHLGHALLYLRSPRAPNECANAAREWRKSCAA